jgi:hypothetical protein
LFELKDHIRFRSCWHYLNDQSHQRNDIGPIQLHFSINESGDIIHFPFMASMRPFRIYYDVNEELEFNHDRQSLNGICASDGTANLRELIITSSSYDPSFLSHVAKSVTSLTMTRQLVLHVSHLTNLSQLSTTLNSTPDYRSIPTSITALNLEIIQEEMN